MQQLNPAGSTPGKVLIRLLPTSEGAKYEEPSAPFRVECAGWPMSLPRSLRLETDVLIDPRLRFYLRRSGASAECVGFDEVAAIANALAGLINVPTLAIAEREIGTLDAFQKYQELLRRAAPLCANKTWFHPMTASAVKVALETVRVNRRKVRLYFGDRLSGVDALETQGTIGWIGRGGAPLPRPILLVESDDKSGMPVDDSAIVRIQDVAANFDHYRHPGYRLPELVQVPVDDATVQILVEGRRRVAFDDDEHAARWLKFMRGEHHHRPRPCRSRGVDPSKLA